MFFHVKRDILVKFLYITHIHIQAYIFLVNVVFHRFYPLYKEGEYVSFICRSITRIRILFDYVVPSFSIKLVVSALLKLAFSFSLELANFDLDTYKYVFYYCFFILNPRYLKIVVPQYSSLKISSITFYQF